MISNAQVFAPPSAERTPQPAAEVPNEYDSGAPVLVGSNRWLRPDGSSATHNGYSPLQIPAPSDDAERWLLVRKYHQTKLVLAWDLLRDLRAAKIHGSEFRWDRTLWGRLPTMSTRYGDAPDLAAAAARMEAICRHHDAAVKELDRALRARGIDPERRIVY